MLQVTVAPPSGNKRKKLELNKSSKVGDLKRLAQKTLGETFLSLVTAEGRALKDLAKSLEAAGVSDGDHLTAVVQQGKLASTGGAFALWCDGDDRILTWGHPESTRDFYAVQDSLGSVQMLQGTRSTSSICDWADSGLFAGAFAAILFDGSVVTWGKPYWGGDSSEVSNQLRNVQQIKATGAAFAAIVADGSVVTWGDCDYGGDSSAVEDQLTNVKQIEGNDYAFAAILADGSVVTWGKPEEGGNSSAVQRQLRSVQGIQPGAARALPWVDPPNLGILYRLVSGGPCWVPLFKQKKLFSSFLVK